jgi:hypothetical protein
MLCLICRLSNAVWPLGHCLATRPAAVFLGGSYVNDTAAVEFIPSALPPGRRMHRQLQIIVNLRFNASTHSGYANNRNHGCLDLLHQHKRWRHFLQSILSSNTR